MTNETEVLRISGNVTVPKGDEQTLKFIFNRMMNDRKYVWEGNIVPQDDESGMRLYVVAEVDMYKQWIKDLQAVIEKHKLTEIENDKLTLSLSEELTAVKAGREGYKQAYERVEKELLEYRIKQQQSQDANLIGIWNLKERNKESRWRTFIKWWKELWK